jgi:beta-glucosidase
MAATARAEAYMNRQFLDPLLLGRYPEELAEIYGAAWTDPPAEDLRLIGAPVDFLGINYYTRAVVRDAPDAPPVRDASVRQDGAFYTETGWEVHPESLERVLLWVKRRYGELPLYITENGIALPEPATLAGARLDDPLRTDYFRRHLRAAHRAVRRGVNLRGYFAWSLLDNLEWAAGFSKRFGLVHVDHATGERTPKASAEFYAGMIRTRGAALDGDDPA